MSQVQEKEELLAIAQASIEEEQLGMVDLTDEVHSKQQELEKIELEKEAFVHLIPSLSPAAFTLCGPPGC